MIISSINKLQAAKSDCKIYENKLYSLIYHFYCERLQMQFINQLEIESGEDLNAESVLTIIEDSVATFEILNDQVSCVTFNLNNVKWSVIKKKLQQNFEEFIYVMDYQAEILNLFLNKCIFWAAWKIIQSHMSKNICFAHLRKVLKAMNKIL